METTQIPSDSDRFQSQRDLILSCLQVEIFCIDPLVKHEVFRVALVCVVHHQFTEQA